MVNHPTKVGDDNSMIFTSYAVESSGVNPTPFPPQPSSYSRGFFRLPTLPRFLADFTLGFADGLTVPFALTAGLSSLGRTDTVIYAGMAEICAGSISMGIGGYLAARGEVAAAATVEEVVAESYGADNSAAVVQEEKSLAGDVVTCYLGPLNLPLHLHEMVLQHIRGCPTIRETLLETQFGRQVGEPGRNEKLPSPFMAGSSVAVGYLLGGLLPLLPYLLVDQVKDGLAWSFGVCAVALFVFGFCKEFALSGKSQSTAAVQGTSFKMSWRDIRRSAWEGAQMVLLGSVAALAAVLCVRAFEGIKVDETGQTS
jgi:VIT1/CCC1 family predicted Fe2+/Mn2+ transporter